MLSLRFSFHSKEVTAPRERSESSVPSYTGLPDAPRRSVGFTSCTGPRTSDEKRGKSQTIIYGREKNILWIPMSTAELEKYFSFRQALIPRPVKACCFFSHLGFVQRWPFLLGFLSCAVGREQADKIKLLMALGNILQPRAAFRRSRTG